MSVLGDARASIESAVATVDGLVVALNGARVLPAGFVLDLVPSLTTLAFRSNVGSSVEAEFTGYLVVNLDSYAQEALEGFIEDVIDAIETQTRCAVTLVAPGIYTGDGGPSLPAYRLTIMVTLSA